ncbi:MAG: DUF6570 domain-containing protein [Candidatus Thiodiazotropha sp.]
MGKHHKSVLSHSRRVSGTCHQGYPHFTDRFAGRQCTVIALVALCFASIRQGNLWQAKDIDGIVAEGHQRYIEIIRFGNSGLRNLQHNEVPRYIHRFMGIADVDIEVRPNSAYGIVGHEGNLYSGSVAFELAIAHAFNATPSVLATFSEYTVGLFFDAVRGIYGLYDSHACNSDGLTSADGVATLFEFQTLDSLISFVISRHRNSLFELSNIEVSYANILEDRHSQTNNTSRNIVEQSCNINFTPGAHQKEINCSIKENSISNCTWSCKRNSSVHAASDNNSKNYQASDLASTNLNLDHAYCNLPQKRKRTRILQNITSEHSYSLTNGILDMSEDNSLQIGMPFEPLQAMYEKLHPQATLSMREILPDPSRHALNRCSARYVKEINMSPDFTCSVCHRFLFENQIKKATSASISYGISIDDILCSWCKQGISKGHCPLSVSHNNLFAGHMPPALQGLSTIEKRCISLVNTFFTLVILPALPVGQFGMKGLVIHLPLPVAEVSTVLSNTQNHIRCVYPSSYSCKPQIVDKMKIQQALNWLSTHNHLYHHLRDSLQKTTLPDLSNENINDCIEIGSIEMNYTLPSHQSSSKTHSYSYTLPLQKKFINISSIPSGEEKAFPTLFPYGINGFTAPRPIKLSLLQYYRSRFYNLDDRWRTSIPYLLSSVGCFERRRLFDLISVYMRVQNKAGSLRVSDILQTEVNQHLLKNSYMFMKNIRGTCAYWKDVLYNLLAMIKNLGCPTFFLTLSANDYHWPELANILKVSLRDLPDAVQKNPLVTALYFERRWRALLKHVLKGKDAPLGDIENYFGRVEFQQRGSPHIHFFVWVKNAPSLYTSNASTLVSFINSTISTTIPDKDHYPSLHKLVKQLQIHSHRPSCRRRNKCRFNFPYEPCNYTKILTALDVLQSKKFYATRRTKNDIMVNAYNPTILLHWQANMDIQMIDGPVGIAYYVCSYVCKAEPDTLKAALSETLKNFEMSSSNPGLRSRLSKIGFCILKHRTLSAQEAAYRIGHLQLVWYSKPIVKVVAVTPENTYRRLKSKFELEQLSSNSTDIFENNIIDYYYARPLALRNISLFSFARSWIVRKKISGQSLSYKLHLKETLFCQQRSKPAVVRITKPAKGTDDYFYSILLLFYPHESSEMLLTPFTSAKDAFIAKHEQFNRTALNIGYRMEDIDSVIASMHLYNIEADSLVAPNTVENNTEPLLVESAELLSNFVTSTLNDNTTSTENSTMSAVDISLTEQQWHSFSSGSSQTSYHEHCSKLTRDQRNVLKYLQKKGDGDTFHIFVTGPGGVGKSFLIKVLVQYLTLFTSRVSGIVPVAVLAPTGVAAFNIQGQTIHSSLRIPVQHGYSASYIELSARSLQTLRSAFQNIHTVLIDEVSMVSSVMLEHIHLRLQAIKNNDLAFGGLNIILVGDFFQLRPVRGQFAFKHSNLWPLFRPFFLNENVRQNQDIPFSQLLNRIRLGHFSSDDIDLLKTRLVPADAVDHSIFHIYPTRECVRQHNNKIQNTLSAPQMIYNAIHYFSENDMEANKEITNMSCIPDDDRDAGGLPSTLTFSVGTRVMLLRNLCVAYGLINGAQGYVTDFQVNTIENKIDCIYVVFDNKDSIPAGVKRLDESVPVPVYRQEFLFSGRYIIREMFPLVPSWAATIHKVQGLTLSGAAVCIDDSIFQHGQAYVALSRVQNLNQLHLLCLNVNKITVDPEVVKQYLNLRALI